MLSRNTLTNVVRRAIDLLYPIADAQLASILESKVLAMDKTPIKTGKAGPDKLKQSYFWPVYGDKDEIAFTYWLFCWTELGAEHVGVIQSLVSTCKLHDINVYDYLTDVLLRINHHPVSKVHELTPRLWKAKFEQVLLRSDLFTYPDAAVK